ncbi:hypothetical protein HYFRA_00004684 [Hymenoscyphus fraxineus]|uniref:Uncharacterized protein n=1 Tax=Hymenoscyphus fraxineus TaxID=746836 RepID=A0A9N9KWI9_9HELO|nr:hypothetical protein HYFRA_00004684 [Hymenoscyphus fraxineus]
MQLQTLLTLALTALATGVNGQTNKWNQAWCDENSELGIVDVEATIQTCNAIAASTDAYLVQGFIEGRKPDAVCHSKGGEIDGSTWPAACIANGAGDPYGGRGRQV